MDIVCCNTSDRFICWIRGLVESKRRLPWSHLNVSLLWREAPWHFIVYVGRKCYLQDATVNRWSEILDFTGINSLRRTAKPSCCYSKM